MADGFRMADRYEMERIGITGLGVVSPIGVGREAFWSALCAGASGIRPYGAASGAIPRVAAQLGAYTPRQFIASTHLRRMDKLSRAIVSAARLAVTDAGLSSSTVASERLGIVIGSALGNISESVQYLERLFTKGPALASPLMFPNLVLNAPASYAAMEFGSTGANLTVSHGEISGEQALAVGCDLIRARRADVVLAGGGDELEKVVIDAYRRFGALSGQRGGPEWCSPYDVERNGLVLGEGAAIVVLESLAAARQRGATVYAEIEDVTRFAVRAPLYDWPRSAPAAVEPLQRLLAQGPQRGAADGGTLDTSNRLDLVCGAANSSRRLDACELDVLAGLFGETAATVTLTSIKGAIGEWGAAGAMTAVAACMALHTGRTPPLCNLRRAPADALFHFAPRAAMPQRLQRALLFAMARGGAAVAMVLRKVEGAG